MEASMLQLTSTQRDIYLEGKFFGGVVNNIGGYQTYSCALDVPRFVRARELLLQGNDAYRLRFDELTGGCEPVVEGGLPPALRLLDFSGQDAAGTAALAWIRQQFALPFTDLAEGVFEDALIKVSAHEYLYYAKAHHLIMDGWGFALQMQRCLELYEQLASGGPGNAQGPSFVAYMREQAAYPASPQYAASRDYWLAQFDSLPGNVLTRKDQSTTSAGATSHRVSTAIDAGLFCALNDVAKAAGANIVAVFQATLYIYFSRAYGCDDLVIGSPVHNRRSAVEKDIIGSLVNVNAHRLASHRDVRFSALVHDIAQLQKKNHRHSRFPIGDLVRALRDRLQSAATQLNQVSFNYQKLDFQLAVEGSAVETHYLPHGQEPVPLTFVVCEYGASQDVAFHLDFRTDFFDSGEAAAILDRIHGLLRQLAVAADLEIHRYRLPTDAEWHRLLVEWNDTAAPRRDDACLHTFFEEQAQRTPDHVAVVCGQESLTYRELDARANHVARKLAALGAGPDRFVGVCHGRTPNLLVAILGVLKAGAAYVPVDPAYPAARIRYILDDARVTTVLADSHGADALPDGVRTVVDIGALLASGNDDDHSGPNVATPRSESTAANLAYVIYTSGSTGNPKGVLIEHRNAAAFVQWALQAFDHDDLAAVLAATSVCFDLSIFEMFVPLAMGGRIVLADSVLALRNGNPGEVTLINTVPSAIRSLLEAKAIPRSVRCINLAGELLRQDLVDALYALPGIKVHDLYGPSEDTTYSTWCLRPQRGRETIGRPIANTQVYVLDEQGNPLPPGLAGELHIGGAGLARGYLNHPALTAEKFVHNRHADSRLYRTGDLVRFVGEGELQYLGRKDNQVKVRGYRIELGEIEARILQHPAVTDCAVIAREDDIVDGGKVIVAYLVADASDAAASVQEPPLTLSVIRLLSESLPAYMVPSQFVTLPALPLSPNGKVDRKALPAPGRDAGRQAASIAPRNAAEHRLRECWQAVLRLEGIGVRDDFFALGGDSLLLMRLAAAIEGEFDVQLDLSVLFANTTVEAQARLLEREHSLARMLEAVSAVDDERCSSHLTL